MLHSTVVDTSVVFPHKMGPPYKRALKFLAADHLKRIIQQDGEYRNKENEIPKKSENTVLLLMICCNVVVVVMMSELDLHGPKLIVFCCCCC